MICNVCHGAGWLFRMTKGLKEWWSCPACAGNGCRTLYGPPAIGPGSRH